MLVKGTILFQHPLLNFSRSTTERFYLVAGAAFLAVLQSALNDGGYSLLIAASCVAGAIAAELCITFSQGRVRVRNASPVVTALVLTLLLPNTIHPVLAALGAIFAIAVVKESFGGLGTNWLNPALGGWLFVRFSWRAPFDDALKNSPERFLERWITESSDSYNIQPVSILSSNGFGTQNGDVITSFLNEKFFSFFNTDMPGNYMDFFLNPGPGIIADRAVYTLLFASIVLLAAKAARTFLPLIYIAVYLFLVFLGGGEMFGGGLWSGDMLFALFSGGTLAAVFFLSADPVTAPKSRGGRVVYMVLAAALSFFFRYVKCESYGALYAIAIINTITPIIRVAEDRMIYDKILYKEGM